ncbi:TLC domain-containing protein 5-like [Galleria mellonella]|uniref:TLC domain-containing protein 5-like n=1 Tax=Galleria mellonella TaxID=7137 RepID=A0ABM3MTN1_GALME|nr:TLC domain-containing protein 5-like [Galleria mellonella]
MELKELSAATLLKLVSFLFWSSLYLWCSIRAPGQSPEWRSRAVTLLHGTVATIIGLSQCGVRSLTPCQLAMKITAGHYALMVWSWGYFAFDLLWCLVYMNENSLILFHHASALIAITLYMQKDYTGCTFACTLALLEVTNPLLQIRWFLKHEGYDKTIIYIVVEALYLIMFLAARGVFGTYIIYKILQSDIFDLDEKFMSVVFYIVSIAFIYDIFGYVLYKYKNKIDEFKGFLDERGILLNESL